LQGRSTQIGFVDHKFLFAGAPKAAPAENNSFNYVWANAQTLSLTIKSKIRQEGERKRVEGKESPERKTDWEKERGGMSDFAAVFFLPSLLVPRGVPLWETRSCRQ